MSTEENSGEDTREEVQNRARLVYDFASQMVSFGPVLATKMSVYSTMSLPWGLGAAGAETVKQGVDAGDAEGISKMTAIMVKLGMLGTVHDIVVTLCAQDRADAVAAVTAGLLTLGEVYVVIQITNALIASSHTNDVINITGSLIQQGNMQILEVVKEAGLDMNLLGGDDSKEEGKEEASDSTQRTDSDRNPGVLESVKNQTASVLERITPEQTKDQEKKKKKSAPDADALFDEWTGVRKEDASGGDSRGQDGDVPPQEAHLL